jgi:hypothetical protein
MGTWFVEEDYLTADYFIFLLIDQFYAIRFGNLL